MTRVCSEIIWHDVGMGDGGMSGAVWHKSEGVKLMDLFRVSNAKVTILVSPEPETRNKVFRELCCYCARFLLPRPPRQLRNKNLHHLSILLYALLLFAQYILFAQVPQMCVLTLLRIIGISPLL